MKINLKREASKRYKHNYDCINSTTSDFGFVQPLKQVFIEPGSNINLQINSSARLAPLPVPTFGKVDLHNYSAFVPMSEIMLNWEEFQSGQHFRGVNGTYVPDKVPNIINYFLRSCILRLSCVTSYYFKGSDYSIYYGDNGVSITANKDTLDPFICQGYNSSVVDGSGPSLYTVLQFVYLNGTCFLGDVYDPFVKNIGLGYSQLPIMVASYDTDSGFSNWDNADQVIVVSGASLDGASGCLVLCFKYSDLARHLFKIFTGLGYKINGSCEHVSLLPLFAFYKAYYDRFAPRRYDNWDGSYCFGLINACAQYGWSTVNSGNGLDTFLNFVFYELLFCYYTDSSDYLNSHIDSTAVANVNDNLGFVQPDKDNSVSISQSDNEQPSVSVPSAGLSAILIQSLLKLTSFVNRNTVIGGYIDNYFKTHFGVSAYQDVPFMSEDVIDLEISDVFSTNESSDVNLGEYAGRGFGRGSGNSYKIEAKEHGFLIMMQSIVPSRSHFYQGTDPTLFALERFDYPQKEFDALGFEITPKSVVVSDIPLDIYNSSYSINGSFVSGGLSEGFGFIPRYSGFKISQDIVNGDLALRGLRDSLSPYHLQRMISTDAISVSHVTMRVISEVLNLHVVDLDNFVAGTWIRFIAKWPSLCNYDRIFYNQGVSFNSVDVHLKPGDNAELEFLEHIENNFTEDNFIVHNFISCTIYNHFKSLSDSFDDDSGNDNDISVEHS